MTAARKAVMAASNRSAKRILFGMLTLAAIAPALYQILQEESQLHWGIRLLALAFWVSCLVPAWQYLRIKPSMRRPIPFLAMIGLLYGLYYALSPALGAANVRAHATLDERVDYGKPLVLAFSGWLLLLFGHYAASRRQESSRQRDEQHLAVDPLRLKLWAILFAFGGTAVDIVQQTIQIPLALRSLLQFAVTTGWLGIGLLVVLGLRRQLGGFGLLILLVAVAANVLVQIGKGSVSHLATLFAVLILSVWVERGHVRSRALTGVIVGVLAVVVLRGVADEYRQVAWYRGSKLPVEDRVTLMADILHLHWQSDGLVAMIGDGFKVIALRSANLELMADVVRRTPSEVPYWNGQTYASLIGLAIPRLIWPDKPTKELGQAFGHRYDYVAVNDTHTAINLPQLIEFYVNFGSWGVLVGMWLIGALYAVIERYANRPGQDTTISIAGVALLVPLFNIESDFSLVFGGLLLNGLAIRLLLMSSRHLIKQNARPRRSATLASAH